MITTFRNLEISNQLLELNIPNDVFKHIKKIFKKDRNLKAKNNFYYYMLKPTYKIGIYLGSPDYSHENNQVVELNERNGKDADNATWYQLGKSKFSFVPNTQEIEKIHYIENALRLHYSKTLAFKDINEFKTATINGLRTEDRKDNFSYATIDTNIGEDSESLIELIETVNWLYDTDFDLTGLTKTQIDSIKNKHSSFKWELGLYYKVKDLDDNRRLALTAIVGDTCYRSDYNYRRNYHNYNSLSWKILDIPHDNPAYNYIDEGTYGTKFENQIPGSVQFDDTVKSLPKSFDPIEYAIGRRKDPVHVFDQNAIDKANKKYMLKVAMNKDNENAKEAIKLKISSRIRNIDKQPLKLNEAIFSNDQIEYSGQILKSSRIEIRNLLTQLYKYHDLDDINYDRAFEMFITHLIAEVMHNHDIDIPAKIGDVDIILHQKTGYNKGNSPYAVYYINNIRVNKDEFEPILQRAACFEDITTYNKFLKQVSACSLKIHGLLDRGIDIIVRNPLRSERIILKLELIRKNC